MRIEVNVPFSPAELFSRSVRGRLRELRALSLWVWGDARASRAFLCRPHPLLRRRSPVQASAGSPEGHAEAMRILNNILHGLPA